MAEQSRENDFSPRVTSPYLMGVYLALNAIPDAYLFLDGPSCFPLKSPSIQGNHDWRSNLSNVSGYHKCITSRLGPSTVVFPRERLFGEVIGEMVSREETGGVFVSARPMAAVTGLDYERLVAPARKETSKKVMVLPGKSLASDWLGGYEEAQLAYARSVDLDGADPKPGKVAIVGYLFDRNEGDHTGNLKEVERLLEGLGLSLETVWFSGKTFEELRAVRDVSAIISLPYGRKAAKVLAERLDVQLVETVLPLGFAATEKFLRDVSTALERSDRVEDLIAAELAEAVPMLEWVIPFVFQTSNIGYIGDPHQLPGFAEIVDMVGAKLSFACVNAQRRHLSAPPPRLTEERLIYEPTQRFLVEFIPREAREVGLDLLVAANVGTDLGDVPIMEFGFPSYFTHFFTPRPFLGFVGTLGLLERMANTMRHRQL